jgi:hypothetical protein
MTYVYRCSNALPPWTTDKPAATYHNGVVITVERPDLALRVDNKGAIDKAHAHGQMKRTKHLDVRRHYLQQRVAR